MSWPERSVRHHKRQTDCAISSAYARFAEDSKGSALLEELLRCVRARATCLLEAPLRDGYHPGVEALVNLARFRREYIRSAMAWSGTDSSWQCAVSSLVQHLLCEYRVPMFLTSSWYARDAAGDTKRHWCRAHGSGIRFRSLDLPIAMTRQMERVFLGSPDHLQIEHAIRRAELLGLGASDRIIDAVLRTRLAVDLSNGEFWRTFWRFLIANEQAIDPLQIGPMIDFAQAIRHERVTVESPSGMVQLDPPQPDFSMKGRTMGSMLRLMCDWHRNLVHSAGNLAWTPSLQQPMSVDEPDDDPTLSPRRWQMMELTDSAQLRTEGAMMHHCVASYAYLCCQGLSRIWSLRFWRGEKLHRVLTIEVDPRRGAIVQARGLANRAPTGKALRFLRGLGLPRKAALGHVNHAQA